MDFANRSGVGFDGDVTSMVLIPDGGVVVAGVLKTIMVAKPNFSRDWILMGFWIQVFKRFQWPSQCCKTQ